MTKLYLKKSRHRKKAGGKGFGISSASERECQTATQSARRLHQIHRMAVLPQNGHIALRHHVAQVEQSFHLSRNKGHVGKGLADKDAEVRIHLSGRLIKRVYRRKAAAAVPAICPNPSCFVAGAIPR